MGKTSTPHSFSGNFPLAFNHTYRQYGSGATCPMDLTFTSHIYRKYLLSYIHTKFLVYQEAWNVARPASPGRRCYCMTDLRDSIGLEFQSLLEYGHHHYLYKYSSRSGIWGSVDKAPESNPGAFTFSFTEAQFQKGQSPEIILHHSSLHPIIRYLFFHGIKIHHIPQYGDLWLDHRHL